MKLRIVLLFDHNATHPLSVCAREAWLAAVEKFPGNPSSQHRLGARAANALEEARGKLAGWLGCLPEEIVWTSGATESGNMALHHFAKTDQAREAWISAIEHPAILEAAHHFFPGRVRLVPVLPGGVVDLEHLQVLLSQGPRPACIACMAANNETGVLQPWRQIAALCREKDIPFLCDAAQWVGRLPANSLGAATMVTGCGHKFGGPAGVGFLKCPLHLKPLAWGGPQEERRRPGTENVAGILAMVAALEERESALANEPREVRYGMRDRFVQSLRAEMGDIPILGENHDRLWNTLSVVMPEIDCRQRWVVKLDKLGIAVSTGSACSSGKEVQSHVLAAMGIPPGEAARVLRISSGWGTSPEDWDRLLQGMLLAQRELSA